MSLNYKVIIKVFGAISTIIGMMMLPALLTSIIYDESEVAFAFIITIVPILSISILVQLLIKPSSNAIKIRDAYFIAGISWFLVSAIGALPYVFSGVMPSYIDAFFESVSGFTTTGATVIDNLSQIPKGILLWRSFSNWLGGMGILVLTISLLPALGIGGMKIANEETRGPVIEKMSTRIADSAKLLYIMYLSFTVIQFVLLLAGGMNSYDAMVHTFGCLGTGGLSNYSNGIAHFHSFYIESIITLFSALTSINFVLYHNILIGKWKTFFADKELRVFFMIILVITLIISFNLWTSGTYATFGRSLRNSIFHVVSFISTSGYTIANYTLWPSVSQLLLLLVMLVGGCSSSTCGGIKIIRIMILFKLIVRGTYKRLHPNSVLPVRIGNRLISAETVTRISSFTLLYITVFIFSSLVLSLENLDFTTTVSATASALSNTGMGFGMLGPTGTYNMFSSASRLFLSVLMIAGRLELFTIIMLLSSSFWRAK